MKRTSLKTGIALLPLIAAMFLACGDDDGGSSATSGNATSGAGAGGMTSSGSSMGGSTSNSSSSGSGMDCPAPAPAHPGVSSTVDNITGKLIGLDMKPVADILTDVCGTNICLSGHSDTMGNFSIMGGSASLDDVALIYGDGVEYVKMAAPIAAADLPSNDFGDIVTVKFPALSEGVALEAGKDATQNGVTVGVGADATIKFDTILNSDPTEQVLRAVVFKPSDGPFLAVPSTLGVEILVAVGATNTTICPAAKLSVPNSEGWDPGTEVEFHYHNHNTFNHWGPYAGWALVSGGKVSTDGKSIETNDGEGVPQLGLFGIKKK